MNFKFGPSGIPQGCSGGTKESIPFLKNYGLNAMELAFVRSVSIKEPLAKEINEIRKKNEFSLTCHAPYYVNLNSKEPDKIKASIKRVVHAAHIADLCGAESVTFHPAYYHEQDPKEVYERVKKHCKDIVKQIQDKSAKITIRPETSGKISQFGSVQEIVNLSQEIDQVLPCIDFAHLYAKSIGNQNKKEDFQKIMEIVETGLGKEGTQKMHIHMSGIVYGDKGEKHHMPLKESDFNWKSVLQTLKEFNAKGIIICESPLQEKDAMLMKKNY